MAELDAITRAATQADFDLRSHPELENEWWYYHGHLRGVGRDFGFHLAFFRRRPDRVRIGRVIPIRLVSNQVRLGHFAVTDIERGKFYYGHKRLLMGGGGAATDRYHVWMHDWLAQGAADTHHLRANIRGVQLELAVCATKQPVRHGRDGFRTQSGGRKAVYFSYPRMEAEGRLTIDGESLAVSGEAWMDRDFGNFTLSGGLHGWDWFAFQFLDGRELMIFQMRDEAGRKSDHSLATLIEADGSATRFEADEFTVDSTESWRSPATGSTYPVAWHVGLPAVGQSLLVQPHMNCHEFDSRGSTELLYWEGPVQVEGRLDGRAAEGRGFVELVGYDCCLRRYDTYDFAADSLSILGWLANEARLRVYGPGVMACEQA